MIASLRRRLEAVEGHAHLPARMVPDYSGLGVAGLKALVLADPASAALIRGGLPLRAAGAGGVLSKRSVPELVERLRRLDLLSDSEALLVLSSHSSAPKSLTSSLSTSGATRSA